MRRVSEACAAGESLGRPIAVGTVRHRGWPAYQVGGFRRTPVHSRQLQGRLAHERRSLPWLPGPFAAGGSVAGVRSMLPRSNCLPNTEDKLRASNMLRARQLHPLVGRRPDSRAPRQARAAATRTAAAPVRTSCVTRSPRATSLIPPAGRTPSPMRLNHPKRLASPTKDRPRVAR